MGKVVRRRLVKISLAILIVVGVLLGSLVLLTRDWGPKISFGFLDGRMLTAHIEPAVGTAAYREIRHVYSFEADFNTVCAEVDAELSKLGFLRRMRGGSTDHHLREYRLVDFRAGDPVVVRILDRQALIAYSGMESLKDSDPARYTYASMDGCVSIEISQLHRRFWPPRYLHYHLIQGFRRSANKPPPKK